MGGIFHVFLICCCSASMVSFFLFSYYLLLLLLFSCYFMVVNQVCQLAWPSESYKHTSFRVYQVEVGSDKSYNFEVSSLDISQGKYIFRPDKKQAS